MKYLIFLILILSACSITPQHPFDACTPVTSYYQPKAGKTLVVTVCVKEYQDQR